LSHVAIEKLKQRIVNFPNARAISVDFLSEDFTENEFDLIYAYGVLHHFPTIPILISKLNEKLANHGQIISYDPLETSWPIKLLRKL
jgi:SAM-dependent methyltransferase